jgi:DNA-binding NtrC family response regulator
MEKVFEKSGYDFTGAKDGQEALDIMSEHTFDLVVSDLRMPNLDGIGLMEEIKKKALNVPIIFLTGYGEIESYMDLMNMGAFDYINKPADTREILNVVRKALETREGSLCGLCP